MKPSLIHACFVAVMAGAAYIGLPSHSAPADPAPSKGGRLPSGMHSDQQSWQHFVQAMTPETTGQAHFETWATDHDVYTDKPVWPTVQDAARKKLRGSKLDRAKAAHARRSTGAEELGCPPVSAPKAGNVPTTGVTSPHPGVAQPCFGEEVRRNRPSFDYLVINGLNTTGGLAQAYERAATTDWKVSLPVDAVEIKADWVPVETLSKWLGTNGVTVSPADIGRHYYMYTDAASGQRYGLVSLHISSKEVPNWVWASFEHALNPGRCDTMGCYDSFGAVRASVAPSARANGQYGSCAKQPALKAMFAAARLPAVLENYCLKGSQIDFVDKSGRPLMPGDFIWGPLTLPKVP